VLLIEAMAQTSGALLVALLKFERMPFLAAVKEAKMRSFVSPGQLLENRRQRRPRRFWFCHYRGEDTRRANSGATPRSRSVTSPSRIRILRGHMEAMAKRIGLPHQAIAHD